MDVDETASREPSGPDTYFAPAGQSAEFYGFFAFSGKFTAFLGPFLLGKMTLLFDSMRVGIVVVVLLFLITGPFYVIEEGEQAVVKLMVLR